MKDEGSAGRMRVKVGGMHCASCAARVERALLSLSGVERAQVNAATGDVLLLF